MLSVTINEFPIPTLGGDPVEIASGPDGNLWFTEVAGKIGQINPTTHAVTEFPVPTAGVETVGITAGPDGNVWFTEFTTSFTSSNIGEINPTTHAILEFPVPTALSEPTEITAGPDGNLWFTEQAASKIGEINPTTHVITEFPIPNAPPGGSVPFGIAVGPDGNLWFTEVDNKIGTINPTTHAITEFPIPTAGSFPVGIVAGPDGNVWFTEESANKIGQINPTTHVITEFSIPTPNSGATRITAGPDGNLWFTERAVGQIATINPTTHAITEFSTPTARSFPTGITTGPDGNLWFDEQAGNIAQAVLSAPPPPSAPDVALSGTAPDSTTLGSRVTYTVTVTNNGTASATGVTLTDTLPAGVSFVSATGGVTPSSGVLTFNIGNLNVGATTSLTIVVTPTAAGTLENQVTVGMNQTDPTPADNSLSQLTAVTSVITDGPFVTSVRRFGIHEHPTRLVLTFNEPLDLGRAQDVNNYQIVALGRFPRAIAIASAQYDPTTLTVTLSPVRRLNFHHRFRLTVIGTPPGGVTDTSGNRLAGQHTGDPGSDFVTIVTARDLVITGTNPGGNGSIKKLGFRNRVS
jgi:uncharacterized repeat protein (TIGR01451 family)